MVWCWREVAWYMVHGAAEGRNEWCPQWWLLCDEDKSGGMVDAQWCMWCDVICAARVVGVHPTAPYRITPHLRGSHEQSRWDGMRGREEIADERDKRKRQDDMRRCSGEVVWGDCIWAHDTRGDRMGGDAQRHGDETRGAQRGQDKE